MPALKDIYNYAIIICYIYWVALSSMQNMLVAFLLFLPAPLQVVWLRLG